VSKRKTWDWRAGLVGTHRRLAPFPSLGTVQSEYIDKILQAYGYNFVHAAKALGISRATLYRKIHRQSGGLKKLSRKRKRMRYYSI
jgi:transcriptional regulator of acetoin/glycerol metabolism